MYLPSHFAETRAEVLRELIAAHPLGTLVTSGEAGLDANHIPFEFDPLPEPLGTLRAHVARANPVWREFSRDTEPLVIFQGPQIYITPSWYATKAETGKVVPTFNYIVVHAYGTMRAIEDQTWLRNFVGKLTERFESTRAKPWAITDAPEDFIASHLRAIVGLEIKLTRLIGKWKTSQNRPQADRNGVVAGLREEDNPVAQAMARAVEDWRPQ
ncbi:MAG: FMN-binding negative transcriptional regulator [Burkholderiales bacterium]|jgi:transcriptional regulator